MGRERKKKSRIKVLRARKKFWRTFTKITIQAIAWVGFAVAYYFVISLYFDTPYEYALKSRTNTTRQQYETMQSHYDSLEMVLDNIEERDRSIFNILFESTPKDKELEERMQQLARHESLLSKSQKELSAELNMRTEELSERCHSLIRSTSDLAVITDKNGTKSNNKIPSIQPISNPQLTLLTASYGIKINPFYRTAHHHNGIDYTIPEGTRVFATADGVVESTNLKSSTLGKSIVINHGNGYKTTYNHLSRIFIPSRRSVKRGEIIGLSGNTGLSLTPHLHYEISYNGEVVDPLNYFFMELTPDRYQQLIELSQTGMQSFD